MQQLRPEFRFQIDKNVRPDRSDRAAHSEGKIERCQKNRSGFARQLLCYFLPLFRDSSYKVRCLRYSLS